MLLLCLACLAVGGLGLSAAPRPRRPVAGTPEAGVTRRGPPPLPRADNTTAPHHPHAVGSIEDDVLGKN
jgi:hypothetical protein